MIILLDGASKIGRIAIAEQAVAGNPAWTHLALEVISESIPEGEDADFHVQVVQKCAAELAKENIHLFLTLPDDVEQQRLLADGLEDCVTIHLGSEEDDGDYDYVIDAATQTMNDVLGLVHTIMNNES